MLNIVILKSLDFGENCSKVHNSTFTILLTFKHHLLYICEVWNLLFYYYSCFHVKTYIFNIFFYFSYHCTGSNPCIDIYIRMSPSKLTVSTTIVTSANIFWPLGQFGSCKLSHISHFYACNIHVSYTQLTIYTNPITTTSILWMSYCTKFHSQLHSLFTDKVMILANILWCFSAVILLDFRTSICMSYGGLRWNTWKCYCICHRHNKE